MVKSLFFFSFLLFFFSCSLQSRREQADIRDLFQRNQTVAALELLEKSEIKKEKKNRLLYLLQKGKLLYAEKRFNRAGATFVQAGELMERLYTKSVSEMLLTGVSNNNSETYYGSVYERSLLFYYQALSFLNVYQRGKILERKPAKEKAGKQDEFIEKKLSDQERKNFLFRARASILAWDTFYKELQRSSRESSFFNQDLFAKTLGAKIHELVGSRGDEQIALQLYKDALEILYKSGPAFKNYNSQFEAYAKAFKGEDFGKKNKSELEKHIENSKSFKGFEKFLKFKILSLAKKRRPGSLKAEMKRLNAPKDMVAKLDQRNNVTVLLESRLIAPLEGKTFSYNLRSAMEEIENPAAKAFMAGVGLPVLTYFAMGPLGIGAVSSGGNSKLYVRHGAGELMTSEAGIEFEMPVIREPALASSYELIAVQESNPKEAAKTELALAGPISDLAYQMNLERASNSYGK
ncbi:MAG: hypothetical protein WD025_07255, partial [Bacteriovoracaceae bacterium]